MKTKILGVAILLNTVVFHQRFGGTCCLHMHDRNTARRKKACTNNCASGFNIIKMLFYGDAGLKARYRGKTF
jgi:hypothetical protein